MEINKETSALVRRVNDILETRPDNDKDTLEALRNLSTFYTENNVTNRRNLLNQIEDRSLTINQNFLQAFGEVKTALDTVLEDISSMDNLVNSMQNRLNVTKVQTHTLIEQSNTLQNECDNLTAQQNIAAAFVKRFQLSPEEHTHIYGATKTAQIDKDFFKALERVKQIHNECRLLVQSGYQTSAVDIMDQMTIHQEAALERLYRWAQSHCRSEENPEISELVRQAMSKLQDRPVLFKYVLDEYGGARRALLVRRFIDAMTGGGSEGGGIEMRSHEPKRYVGDMLAWLHQATPCERDRLTALLRHCDNTDMSECINHTLCHITDGVCHPLKIRIERVLASEKQTTVLYSISSLVRFYQGLMSNSIAGGVLDATLTELIDQSERAYLTSLQHFVESELKPGSCSPPGDLSPCQSVSRLMSALKDILSIAAMAEGRQADIKKIVSCVLDPLLAAILEHSTHLPTTDMAVYQLNCLYHIQCTLALYEYMDDRLERLQAQSEAQLDTLTSEQAGSLVANLNLGAVYTILQERRTEDERRRMPLSSLPGMDAASLKLFVGKLNSLTEMPEVLLLPQVTLLSSSAHRSTVQRRSYEVIIAIYRQLYERVHERSGPLATEGSYANYSNPHDVMPDTPDVVAKRLLPE